MKIWVSLNPEVQQTTGVDNNLLQTLAKFWVIVEKNSYTQKSLKIEIASFS